MEVYEVFGQDGEKRGRVAVGEQGLYTEFDYAYPGSAPPSRLMLRGSKGEADIGVPVPEGGEMRLRRRLPRSHLRVGEEREFCLVPIGDDGEKKPKKEETTPRKERRWREEPHPEELVADGELRESLRGTEGALVSQVDEDIFLALRYTPGGVFPLMPAFRYGVSAVLGGKTYIVFRLRDGVPV